MNEKRHFHPNLVSVSGSGCFRGVVVSGVGRGGEGVSGGLNPFKLPLLPSPSSPLPPPSPF